MVNLRILPKEVEKQRKRKRKRKRKMKRTRKSLAKNKSLDKYKRTSETLDQHQRTRIETDGTNFELSRVEKYNRSFKYRPAQYYITLVAMDPSTGSHLPFQTILVERSCCPLLVCCNITRPKEKATEPTSLYDMNAPQFYYVDRPVWPSDIDPFDDHTGRFYVVKQSELEENNWIRLYLDLSFIGLNRHIHYPNLSCLTIVNVAVETEDHVEPPTEKLKGAINATFYIRYNEDLGEGQISECKFVVRRAVDLKYGRFVLLCNLGNRKTI